MYDSGWIRRSYKIKLELFFLSKVIMSVFTKTRKILREVALNTPPKGEAGTQIQVGSVTRARA